MIIATHGIVASQILTVPVATAATSVGETSFTANWNAYSGATYYLLDVSTSSSFSSYVLQDKVVYSTSYAVTGLASNTTYYYRVRASTEYDTDASAFFSRVTTAGGSLSTTEQQAVNSLVLDMKSYSIWTKMKAIYPMVGASAAACSQNLKSSSFTGTFTATGWTFASSGVTPNGTSAYMDTGLNPNTQLSSNNGHLSFYSRTNNSTGEYPIEMGCENTSTNGVNLSVRMPLDNYKGRIGGNTYLNYSNTNSSGFYVISRTSSTNLIGHKNGLNQQTLTTTNTYSASNFNIFIGAQNRANVAELFTTRQCAFASIGDGLTDTEAGNFYTAVQAFQTTLTRNV